jgi:hypothetical protein
VLDFRVQFFRKSRDELLARRRVLIAEAERLSRAQARLADRVALVRAELVAQRERLWPREPGRAWSWQRRPRVGGPPPIPRPQRDATPLSGKQLRYAALGVLVRAGRPLGLAEIHAALHLAGYRLSGRRPVQQLADALGYEHEQGRARRVMRSVYTVGTISPSRRRRAWAATGGRVVA